MLADHKSDTKEMLEQQAQRQADDAKELIKEFTEKQAEATKRLMLATPHDGGQSIDQAILDQNQR
jgi:hypothetical protein